MPDGAPWTTAQIARLRHGIDALLRAPTLRGAQIGFLAIDATRAIVLYSRNADEEFMPASNFKLLAGSAALRRLGINFAYVTTVLADAAPSGGVLDGNLYLRGGGDSLLGAADLDAAAAAVAAAGVTRVTGSVVTDASHDDRQRLGYGWSWDDLPYYYAPVVTALELEDGVVHVRMIPGSAAGTPVVLRVTPESSAFTIDDRLRTGPRGSHDTSDIVRPWDEPRTIRLTGNYPLGARESGDLEPSVPDPESYAGDVFARALAARGVAVSGGVRSGRTPARPITLWSHDSLAMPKLLARFWYPSDNLMGELLLKELGVMRFGEPGTDAHGAIVERQYLRSIGVDPDTVSIADGSGLSQYDRITPRDLVAILQSDWRGPDRDVVIDALPLSGVRGTLRRAYIGTPAERRVYAKTGSISHVRTISGFVVTRTHGVITFSLLINQWVDEDRRRGSVQLAKVRAAIFSLMATQ
ncbi:MAG TPA: D-alanyl-D-alanine carboxypeptidase/D-alanyl-D-alanine-endopeptidase [Candidatus Tyrphobacter sp.]